MERDLSNTADKKTDRDTEKNIPRAVSVYALRTDTIKMMDWQILRDHMPSRMARADRFRFERDRLLCVGAGLLMMNIAGIKDESELQQNEYGKLSAPSYPAFNISHSGEWCVLAMDTESIGVDIEIFHSRNLHVASRVYTPQEISWMNEERSVERFHTLWTLKESVLKACGRGFSLDPRDFDVLPLCSGSSILLSDRSWYAASLEIEDYSCSVCLTRPVDRIDWIECGPGFTG